MEPRQIIELVEKEKYEEALGVSYNAPQKEINVVHLKLASKFRDNQETQEALHKAFGAISNEDDAEKGQRLSKIGKHEEAVPYLKKAAEAHVNGLNYHWLGSTLCELTRYQEALPYLRGAIELRGNAYDQHWLGRALFELGRCSDALPHIKKAVELRGSEGDKNLLEACEYKINPPPVTIKNISLSDLNLGDLNLNNLNPDQLKTFLESIKKYGVDVPQRIVWPSGGNDYLARKRLMGELLTRDWRTPYNYWMYWTDWIITGLKILGGLAIAVVIFLIWKFFIAQ